MTRLNHVPPTRVAVAVAASIAGFAAHNLIEFGVRGLTSFAEGFLPFVAIQLALLAAGWRAPPLRHLAWLLLAATGVIQLVGGALTAVPLPFLAFVPDSGVDHVGAHVVFAVLQLPLIMAMVIRRP